MIQLDFTRGGSFFFNQVSHAEVLNILCVNIIIDTQEKRDNIIKVRILLTSSGLG